MRNALLLTCAIFWGASAQSQINLGRQVIGAAAVNGGETVHVRSTLGEPAYNIYPNETISLKEGFQQGEIPDPLEVNVEVVFQACWNNNNAALEITTSGCGNVTSIVTTTTLGVLVNDITAIAAGGYFVTVTSDGGCTVTTEINIPIPSIAPCELLVYNTVTPNGDALNDHWHIDNINLPQYLDNSVKIYNRWGNLVWEGQRYDNTTVRFVGKDLNNKTLTAGTYFYAIQLPNSSFTGYIQLLQ